MKTLVVNKSQISSCDEEASEREEKGDQMRNWRWRRKGGGWENASDERSIAASKPATAVDDESVAMAEAAGTVLPGEGAGATVTLRSPAFLSGLESLQLSVQHGIEACTDAAPSAALVMQQAPSAGKAATKASTATATAAVKCFLVMLSGLTILMNSMVSIGISISGRHA